MIPDNTYAEMETLVPDEGVQLVVRVFIRKAFREAWDQIVEKSEDGKVSLRDVRDILKIVL